MPPPPVTVIARQGDTLDLICRRHYGRTRRVTEQALDSNPGLADQGPILHPGQAVILTAPKTPDVRPQIHLWD